MKNQRGIKKLVGMLLVFALIAGTLVLNYEPASAAEQIGSTVTVTSSKLKKANANISISLNGIQLTGKAFTVKGKIDGIKERIIYIPAKELVEAGGGTYKIKGKKVTISINNATVTFKIGKNAYTLTVLDENGKKEKYSLACGKSANKDEQVYVPIAIMDALSQTTDNSLETALSTKKKTLDITVVPNGFEPGPITGGWGDPETPEVPEALLAAFEKENDANEEGIKIIPVAVLKQQVVAGMNYKLLCRLSDPSIGEDEVFAIFTAYFDLQGNLTITEVIKTDITTNINDLPGGWSQFENPAFPAEYLEFFYQATSELDGVSYNPIALVSKQVVNGMNLCILTEATVVYPGAEPYYVLLYVYVNPIAKTAEIQEFKMIEGAAEAVTGREGNEPSDGNDFGAVDGVDYMRMSGNYYSVETLAGLQKVLYTEERPDGSYTSNIAGVLNDITITEEIHSMGYLYVLGEAVITIEKGGYLEASVEVFPDTKIIVKDGGTLATTMGGSECIQNKGQIIVEKGGILKSQMGGTINNEKSGSIVIDGDFLCGCAAYDGTYAVWFTNEGKVEGTGNIILYGQTLDETKLDMDTCKSDVIKLVGKKSGLTVSVNEELGL